MHLRRICVALCTAGVVNIAVRLAVASTIGPNVGVAASPTILENQPQVAVSLGRMVAVWFHGLGDRGGYSYSGDGGTTWSPGAIFPRGSFLQVWGFPVVCADDSGRFYAAIWGITSTIQSFGIYKGTFAGNRLSWDGPYFYPGAASGTGYQRPSIACDRSGSHVYLAYTENGNGFIVKFARSLDGGRSWSDPVTLAGTKCDGVRIAVGPDGELYVVWHDYASEQIRGCRSVDSGATFGPVFTAGPIHDNASVNPPGWQTNVATDAPLPDCQSYTQFVNSPSIAVDRTSSPRRGNVYLTWAEYGAGTVQPATGSTGCVNTFFYSQANSIPIGDDLSGYAARLCDDCYQSRGICRFSGAAGTTFWLDGSWQSGAGQSSFEVRCGPDTLNLIDIGTRCVYNDEPVSRAMIWTVPTDSDPYYLLAPPPSRYADAYWQLRLREYVIDPSEAARDERDVVLLSSSDGGQTWSPKVRVNDDPPRYDNSMPEVAVDSQGRVHVAWYDRREQPECAKWVQTYWTWSADGGQSFQPSQRVSEQISGPIGNDRHPWYPGVHMCLNPVDDDVLMSWVRQTSGNPDVVGARVSAEVQTAIVVSGPEAVVVEGGVRVRWYVTDGSGVTGYRVHRAEGTGAPYRPLAESSTAADHEGSYDILDIDVRASQTYDYRLEVVRLDGASAWYGPAEVKVPPALAPLRWGDVAPNPSMGSVRMALIGSSFASVDVRVFEVTGHEVVKVYRGTLGAGTRTWTWNGRDRTGRPSPPGVYVLWARSGGKSTTRRITLLR